MRVTVHQFGGETSTHELPTGATVADAIRASGVDPRDLKVRRLSPRARGSLRELTLDTPVRPDEDVMLVQEVVGG